MRWAPDAKFIYITPAGIAGMGAQKTFVVPLRPGKVFPALPASGIKSEAELAALPGVRAIARPRISPGPDPAVYAFIQVSTHSNLYRIPLP